MLIGAEAVLFLIGTLAVGPGLLANTLLKDHWARARRIDVTIGGTSRFTPWWDPRGRVPEQLLIRRRRTGGRVLDAWRRRRWPRRNGDSLAYGAALAFGSAVGVLRVAGGGTFSPTSCSPACSCICSFGRRTA